MDGSKSFLQRILAEQYERALELIRRHRDKVDALSAALLEHQVVHKSYLEELLGDKVRRMGYSGRSHDFLFVGGVFSWGRCHLPSSVQPLQILEDGSVVCEERCWLMFLEE